MRGWIRQIALYKWGPSRASLLELTRDVIPLIPNQCGVLQLCSVLDHFRLCHAIKRHIPTGKYAIQYYTLQQPNLFIANHHDKYPRSGSLTADHMSTAQE